MKSVPCLLFLLSLFFGLNAYGQEEKVIDSLTRILNQNPEVGQRVDILNALAASSKLPSDKIDYANKALELAKELNDQKGVSDAYYHLGYGNIKDGDSFYFDQALQAALAINYKNGIANAYFGKGTMFKRKGKYAEARVEFFKAAELYEALKQLKDLGDAYNELGLTYAYESNFSEALPYLEKSRDIRTQIGDMAGLSNVLNTWGVANKQTGDLKKALEYYFESLAIAEERNDKAMMPKLLINLGSVYLDLGDNDQALANFSEAKDKSIEINDQRGIGIAYSNLASTYKELGKYDSVTYYLYKSINHFQALGDKYSLIFAYDELAKEAVRTKRLDSLEVYTQKVIDLGNETGNQYARIRAYITRAIYYNEIEQYDAALEDLFKANNLAEKVGDQNQRINALYQIYRAYKGKNYSAKALAFFEKQTELLDSMQSESNVKELANLEAAYKYEKEILKDSIQSAALLEAQKLETKQKQTTSYFLLFGLILALIFGYILWNHFKVTRQQKLALDEANSSLKEMDQFKSRFFTNISHEFRTPLTVISGVSDQLENEQAKGLIKRNSNQLLQLINQILDLRKLESGSLNLNYVQADVLFYLRYILESFESLAAGKDIELAFKTEESSMTLDFDREKLLRVVSNLISNAIKFTPKGGQVALTLSQSAGSYQIQVSDTGIGIGLEEINRLFDRFYQVDGSLTRANEGTGIGLTLVKELVEFMGGTVGVQSVKGTGTTFTVNLPVSNDAALNEDVLTNNSIKEQVSETTSNSSWLPIAEAQDDKPRLLVVEDNKDVMEYLTMNLKS
ncbi:MAG: tetratricopeptide repeat-containing sensor histidine kinase, partial [Bacteroidota bacterium]